MHIKLNNNQKEVFYLLVTHYFENYYSFIQTMSKIIEDNEQCEYFPQKLNSILKELINLYQSGCVEKQKYFETFSKFLGKADSFFIVSDFENCGKVFKKLHTQQLLKNSSKENKIFKVSKNLL